MSHILIWIFADWLNTACDLFKKTLSLFYTSHSVQTRYVAIRFHWQGICPVHTRLDLTKSFKKSHPMTTACGGALIHMAQF